jgi:hypothetical protein
MTKKTAEFYCTTCGHTFDSEEELLLHRETGALRHNGMIHCDECDGYFESPAAFREHLQAAHRRQA